MPHFALFPHRRPTLPASLVCPLLEWLHLDGRTDLFTPWVTPGSRTRDFTVVGRYNYRYAVKTFIKLDESIYGVTVVIPTNDREIPGSIPRRYNLQIKITSLGTYYVSG